MFAVLASQRAGELSFEVGRRVRARSAGEVAGFEPGWGHAEFEESAGHAALNRGEGHDNLAAGRTVAVMVEYMIQRAAVSMVCETSKARNWATDTGATGAAGGRIVAFTTAPSSSPRWGTST